MSFLRNKISSGTPKKALKLLTSGVGVQPEEKLIASLSVILPQLNFTILKLE